ARRAGPRRLTPLPPKRRRACILPGNGRRRDSGDDRRAAATTRAGRARRANDARTGGRWAGRAGLRPADADACPPDGAAAERDPRHLDAVRRAAVLRGGAARAWLPASAAAAVHRRAQLRARRARPHGGAGAAVARARRAPGASALAVADRAGGRAADRPGLLL